MKDENKTKKQLVDDLAGLRQLVIDFISLENKRKQAEEELINSEKFNRAVLDSLMAHIAVLDKKGEIVIINDAWKSFTMKHGEKFPFCVGIGSSYLDFCRQAPEELIDLGQEILAGINGVLSGIKINFSLEYSYPSPEGEKWFLMCVTPLAGGDEGAVVSHVEITRHKQEEEKLRQGERLLFNVFESIPDGICIIDKDYNVLCVNPAMEKMYSHAVPLPGGKCYRVFHGQNEICTNCPSRTALETIKPGRSVVPKRTQEGNVTGWVELHCHPLVDPVTGRAKGVIEYVRDVTQDLKKNREVTLSEKLNLAVEMAAGIGHEFRNPMTTVRGLLQMLGNEKECGQYREHFQLMIEEVDRANSIITELLSLTKKKDIDLISQNLNAIVKSLSPEILEDTIGSKKHVKLELQDIPDLPLDSDEIRQLIKKLVRNGLEAMSPGKCLTIRTIHTNNEIVLSVQDEGEGINPQLLEKIGTPFFTTKDKGTGLGLALCYSIAARHNANIKVTTSPTGTTFSVYFKINNPNCAQS